MFICSFFYEFLPLIDDEFIVVVGFLLISDLLLLGGNRHSLPSLPDHSMTMVKFSYLKTPFYSAFGHILL